MVPIEGSGPVTWTDPPLTEPGMRRMNLDTKGRLLSFEAVPPRYTETLSNSNPQPDWSLLFADAGLEMTKFTRTAPAWTPRLYSDTRVAWTGSMPEWPGETLRVEAGSFAGTPVFFELKGPWTKTPTQKSSAFQRHRQTYEAVLSALWAIIIFAVIAVAGYSVRRNLLTGRGDRTGARRLVRPLCFCAFRQPIRGDGSRLELLGKYHPGLFFQRGQRVCYLASLHRDRTFCAPPLAADTNFLEPPPEWPIRRFECGTRRAGRGCYESFQKLV